ncbi:MAG TPA: hypothetical protein VFG58_05810 [Solirubrobacterales bacterium]|nr:hypothetical protein [Solirubrobacterales bacterium]
MGSSVNKTSLPLLGLAVVVALLAAVPVALAAEGEAELTRDEYIARVEPICAANTRSNSKILKGVKQQVKKGKLKPAGRRFIRASGVLNRSTRQISRVPRPAADSAKLSKWIGYLRHEGSYLLLIGRSLKSGNKYRAQKLAVKLNKNNNQANNTVISFGFKECRIDSSRFI